MPKKPTNKDIKSKIKGIEFLIHKEEVPEHIKKLKRKELKECYKQLAKTKEENQLKKIDKKYKHIKLIEWRKVNRKVSSLQKDIKEKEQKGETDVEQEKQLLESLKQDILYIEHYPSGEPYLSLFPKDGKITEKQTQMKERILQEVKEGKTSAKKFGGTNDKKKNVNKDESDHEEEFGGDPQAEGIVEDKLEDDPFFLVEDNDDESTTQSTEENSNENSVTEKPPQKKKYKPIKVAKVSKPKLEEKEKYFQKLKEQKRKEKLANAVKVKYVEDDSTPWNKEDKYKTKDKMVDMKAKPKMHVKFGDNEDENEQFSEAFRVEIAQLFL